MTDWGQRIARAQETGEWWVGAIWAAEDYEPATIPREARSHALAVLRQAFPADWYRQAGVAERHHPLGHYLTSGGSTPAAFLVNLARVWEVTATFENVNHVQVRVRRAEEFWAALFELQVAAFLDKQGIRSRFLPPRVAESSPDLEAIGNAEHFFVEVKTLEDSDLAELLASLHIGIWSEPRIQALPARVDLTLHDPIWHLLAGWRRKEGAALVRGVVEHLTEQILLQHREQGAPSRREIQPYATCALLPPVPEQQGGLMSLHSPTPPAGYELSRLLRHGLREAARQLPRGAPGVVAVKVPLAFDFNLAATVIPHLLTDLGAGYTHVAGVYLVGYHFIAESPWMRHTWRFVANPTPSAAPYPSPA